MDQNSPKDHPDGPKASWRSRLGLTEKLPKLADEFAEASETESPPAERREPRVASAPPPSSGRPAGAPVSRPAPMAPRAPTANGPSMDFGERIRQQREAAERMAEQRVAEAKERAGQERAAAAPGYLSTGAANAQKPRFTFAQEEITRAQQDTVAQAANQWNPAMMSARPSRPTFTADRGTRPAETVARTTSPSPVRPQAPTSGPQPGFQPRPNGPAPSRPPSGPPPAGHLSQQRPPSQPWPPQQRPRAEAPHQHQQEAHRREPTPAAFAPDDAYPETGAYRPAVRRPEPPRERADYRGAHARELQYVEEQSSDDLFEEERSLPKERRRAAAQDYSNAYRDYDDSEVDEPRRRMGPFLLLLALLGVAAIAGGLIYFYQSSTGANDAADTAVDVPVISEQPEAVKVPATSPAADDGAANEEQGASPGSTQTTSGQNKQIYDRILGETTQEETNSIAPAEEQPVVPNPAGDTDTGSGTEAEPLPLPLPPPPGGSSGSSGALEQPGSSTVASAQAAPAAATPDARSADSVASVESVTESESTPEASTPTAPAAVDEPADTASADAATDPAPVEEAPAAAPPPEPAVQAAAPAPKPPQPAASAVVAENDIAPVAESAGGGPISITPGQNETALAGSGAAIEPAPALPDVAQQAPAQSSARAIGRRAADRVITSAANTNFNRSSQNRQVAAVEPEVISTSLAPAAPAAPASVSSDTTASIEPATPQPEASSTGAAGYVLQLASYKSQAEATAEYDRLRQKHAGILGGLTPEIQKADLGSLGTYYRLKLGTLASAQAAREVCNSLLAAGERDCLAKPR